MLKRDSIFGAFRLLTFLSLSLSPGSLIATSSSVTEQKFVRNLYGDSENICELAS